MTRTLSVKTGMAVALFAIAFFAYVGTASAATLNVPVPFATIQAAVTAAVNGDVINIAAGIYDAQVVISGKDITLQGAGDTTIIRPSAPATLTSTYTYPAGMYAPWTGTVMGSIILVENSANVTVKNLKVDGVNVTGLPAGASRVAGILYGESGGTVDNVTVTTMVVNGYATRSYGIDLSAAGTARNVEVKNSDITDWSRNGIQAQGGSLTADIHDNTLLGPGDTLVGAAVPNGILFIHDVGGNATGNTISALHTSVTASRSAGILVFDPVTAGIVIEDNDISDTDDGVNISANANDVIIRNNNLHDNLEVGIHLEDGATDTTITGNTITGNDMAGIRFAGAADPGGPSLADDPPGAGNVANRNNISGNAEGVVNYDDTPQVFDASCNWWGSASGPSGSGPGSGDSVSTNVTFQPWLTTSNLSGPCNGPLPPRSINSTSITFTITNRGSIDNTTSARSHTGDNTAEGSVGGQGGQGGDVEGGDGSENNGGASAGNGGNGGSGDAGGLVNTGDATSEAGTENDLNGTDAGVDLGDCGCGDINGLTLDVDVDNDRVAPTQNVINNDTRARARTGENLAVGSTGGDAGNGGEVEGGSGNENNGGASAGTGGAGGAGGPAGAVFTGNAVSTAGTVNMLNFTRVRFTR